MSKLYINQVKILHLRSRNKSSQNENDTIQTDSCFIKIVNNVLNIRKS